MKQPFRAIIPLLFSVALLLSLTTTASAAFSDFTDVKGHWAEGTLHQAYDDGILKGYDAKTMAPNRSVTMVQAVTILCRVLHVTGLGDISQFEIPQDAWYAQDVAKGVYAGLLEEQDAQVLNDPIPRGQAFILFGQAFQVVGAQPDLSVLDQFPDTAFLTGEQARAAAALVEAGIVSGSGGALQLDRPLTRAEFATILYRLADQYIPAAEYEGHIGTGSVLSGDAETIPFPDKSTLITSCSALQWFESPEEFFKRCNTLLHSQGYFAFSTFGKKNMKEIRELTGKGLPYRSKEELEAALSFHFDILYSEEELIPLSFEDPMKVLYHLKQTGVNGLSAQSSLYPKHEKQAWTRRDLQHFCERYTQEFTQGTSVSLTYHPIYIIAKKKKV